MEAPDRPGGFPVWIVVVLVAAASAVGVWWIVRSDPNAGSQTQAKATHAPCQPVASTSGAPGTGGTAQTPDWTITVTGASAEGSVTAQDHGTYRAAPGEVFIVVAVTFQNLHPGTEAPVSTRLARLECADGTEREIAGFDDGRGFCRVCGLDLGTDQRRVRWGFIFRMEREFLGQSFRLHYGDADPIDLSLAG